MKKNKLVSIITVLMIVVVAYIYYQQSQTVLRIYDYKTGEIYVQVPAKAGDKLYFGWFHSWDKIPWDEYYHIEKDNTLVLDTIAIIAFAAGIPENKGKTVRIENGVIYMQDIGQVFEQFTWLNSHFAVKDIKLNGQIIASGSTLPDLTRLNLVIERKGFKQWERILN